MANNDMVWVTGLYNAMMNLKSIRMWNVATNFVRYRIHFVILESGRKTLTNTQTDKHTD